MKTLTEPAIVVSVRPYQDADLLLTFLGAASGKHHAIAKHARSSKRRFFGGVDLFDCGTFERAPSKRNPHLSFLHSVSDRVAFPLLRTRLDAFTFGSLCLEVTDRFTAADDPEGGSLFRPLIRSLKSLGKNDRPNESLAIASYYCLLTLKLSGFSLLDDTLPLSVESRTWFEEMLRSEAPILPHQESVSSEGFYTILRYLEKTLGSELRTSAPLRKKIC